MASSASIDVHFEKIAERLDLIIATLDDLLEDPIFLDTINGEQELSLDLALEMLDGVCSKFEKKTASATIKFPLEIDDSYDAD